MPVSFGPATTSSHKLMTEAQIVPVTAITTAQATREVIHFSHRTRRILWWLLVSLQLLTATLLAVFASIYFTRNTRDSLLWTTAIYFIFADGYDFINRFSFTVAMGYALLSAAFAFGGLRLVWFSLRSRRLSFGGSVHRHIGADEGILPTPAGLHYQLQRWSSAVGVHGTHFDQRQLASEVVALASQTTAAYLSSHSISNVYLNQTYGVVIFLNGISTLAFSRLLRRCQLTQRFACLLTDVVLDFVWGCVLPLWMYAPIWKIYQEALAESMMDGESSAREIRRVFVLSWPSYLLSIIPFANSLLTALELQSILRNDVKWISGSRSTTAASHGHRHRWWINWAHALFAVYGCVVLGISLSAADIFGRVVVQPRFECQFRLYPWFSTKEACMKRTIDCLSVGIVGTTTDLDAALGLLDEGSLSDISFAYCEALEMPSSLTRFTTLETIIVDHSWISSWPAVANLSSEAFPQLKTIKLLHVDTNATLHGLVSVPLASTVEYIRFNHVPNAASILDPVGDNWQHLIYFDCDRCNLTSVPPAVDAMHQLLTLSLVDSSISVLRDDFIIKWNLSLIGLWMDGNAALTTLSDVVWSQAATADMFTMEDTNLSAIPDWVSSVAGNGFVVYAYGTPLCDPVTPLVATMADGVRSLVVCEDHDNS